MESISNDAFANICLFLQRTKWDVDHHLPSVSKAVHSRWNYYKRNYMLKDHALLIFSMDTLELSKGGEGSSEVNPKLRCRLSQSNKTGLSSFRLASTMTRHLFSLRSRKGVYVLGVLNAQIHYRDHAMISKFVPWNCDEPEGSDVQTIEGVVFRMHREKKANGCGMVLAFSFDWDEENQVDIAYCTLFGEEAPNSGECVPMALADWADGYY